MKTRLTLSLAIALSCLVFAVRAADDAKAPEFKTNCPVSGQPAKKENSVDHMGRKVYFCCENCPAAFKKDPKKFASKVGLQFLETSQAVQVACPLTGEPLDTSTAITIGNAKVAFCCNDCKGKVEGAGRDQQVAKVFAEFDKAFTVQTTCPVSGKAIKADAVVEHEGKKVYFCCPNCPAAFKKEPAKFLSKLPQFQK